MSDIFKIHPLLFSEDSTQDLTSVRSFNSVVPDFPLTVIILFSPPVLNENDVFDYDFNNDGINEKVVVTYNAVDNLIGAVVSIYTNQGGKEILTYQVAFDKKFDVLEYQAMQEMFDKVKEYYPEYSKNIQPNETRYITIYGDNKNSNIVFDKVKFNNHAPENTNNFLFIKKSSSRKGCAKSSPSS